MGPITKLLAELVAIPSVNPMGAAVGPEHFEAGMSAYLEPYLRALGVRVERVPILPGRDNILAYYDAPDARRTVLLSAHQDTVSVAGMTIGPFTPTVEGGRLHGRGSCDVKGGMASMLSAFARLVRERPAGSASVVMACTVDEEYTHKGSSALASIPGLADLAIVAEPTMLQVVDTHKGAVRWKVRTEGTACHSSTPDRGDNAIYRMAKVVTALEAFSDHLASRSSDPVLGPPSLSVGRIEGGQAVNIVPDWCEVEVDRRLIPGEDPALVADEVEAFLRGRGLGERVRHLPPWVNMPSLARRDAADPWLRLVVEAIGKVRGRLPEVVGVPFGTDAGPLGASGMPSFVLGPGDIAQAHTKDEWIEVDQLEPASEIYYEIARAAGD